MEDTRKIEKFMDRIKKWKVFDEAEPLRAQKMIVWLDLKEEGHNFYQKLAEKEGTKLPKVIVFR